MPRVSVPIQGPLHAARHLERPNRFLVRCRLEANRRLVAAHLADPGRLRELLVPGRRVWLRPARGSGAPGATSSRAPARKTAWSAVLVETPEGDGLVSLDTTLPNRLVAQALRREALEELGGWRLERAEWRWGRCRFDLVLAATDGRRLAMEVKSVTLVENRVGLFPDAVTARGSRHVRELAELARTPGWCAAILFVVQRADARRVVAAREIDAEFAAALQDAKEAGVRVLGRRCRVSLERVTLGGRIPAE